MRLPDVVSDSATDAAKRLGAKNMVDFFEMAAAGFSNPEEVAVRWYSLWLTKGYEALPETCQKFCLKVCNGEVES